MTTATPCAACTSRREVTTVQDHYTPGFDAAASLGLQRVGDELFACAACGTRYRRSVQHGEAFEDHDAHYFTRLPAPTGSGCAQCGGGDAEAAWAAARQQHLHTLVDESHYGVALTACRCGQTFAKVFTERIDWVGGEDDQTTLLLPLTTAEAEALRQCPPGDLRERLQTIGHGRRFVLRTFPRDGALQTAWRDGGFWVGPHD